MVYSEPQSLGRGKKSDRLEEHKTTISIFPISTQLKNLRQQATDGLMLSAVFRLWAISRPLKAKKTAYLGFNIYHLIEFILHLHVKQPPLAKTRFQLTL